MKHLINWVEIPVHDVNRAMAFYTTILAIEFQVMQMGESIYAIFPAEDKFNTGALVQGPYHKPTEGGVMIYLDGGKDMDTILSKVGQAGGNVVMEKTFLANEAGFVGMFVDTEGNQIGLQHM